MSLRPDGAYRCDRCGTDVGNGSVLNAAIVTDLDPTAERATPRLLHLCRAPRDGAPNGCAGNVLGPGTLADWTAWRSS